MPSLPLILTKSHSEKFQVGIHCIGRHFVGLQFGRPASLIRYINDRDVFNGIALINSPLLSYLTLFVGTLFGPEALGSTLTRNAEESRKRC